MTREVARKILCTVSIVLFCVASHGQANSLGDECSAYANVPLPEEASHVTIPVTAPACASYKSYRGIGRPVNYTAARTCAWQERLAEKANLEQNPKEPIAWAVGGSTILADMYYNGAGVKKNVPLAFHLMCDMDESWGQLALDYLVKKKEPQEPHKRVEFCDYALTTFSMNFCLAYENQVDEDRRDRFYKALRAKMTTQQAAAFDSLLQAKNKYIEEHRSEVDQGGTIRGIRTMGSMWILEDLFRTDVVHFERKQWPTLSAERSRLAEQVLQRTFQKKIAELKLHEHDEFMEDAVKPEGLTKAEEAWLNFRDAWKAFAQLRYPAQADAIVAKITLDRARYIKTI